MGYYNTKRSIMKNFKWYHCIGLLLVAGVLAWWLFPITAILLIAVGIFLKNFPLQVLVTYLFWVLFSIGIFTWMRKMEI